MSAELRFDGRVAVITGAGAGLGKEYALLLGKRGAKVVVNDLGGSSLGEGASRRAADVVVQEIISAGGIAAADYNSVVDGHKIIETAVKNFGKVDILINNAGILRDRSLLKTSDEDWNLVHDVHLKGSFKCTQAAFEHMKRQNYGRIIMTSSNSGLCGNFGQSNYSAAKMGLIGLTNTVAIEGGKYNIHCNTIVPTAASRLTKDVMPEFLFNELKPKLIAPVVAYLCHESCEDNGSYIDTAAGWAGKVQIARGRGAVLRNSIQQDTITPESVKEAWSKISDMSQAKYGNTMNDLMQSLIEVLENLREGKSNDPSDTFTFNSRDLILYALGIGATTQNPQDLKFLYENDAEFSPIPLYFVMPGLIQLMSSDLLANSLPKGIEFNLARILHGEQYLEICDDLPTSGTLTTSTKVIDVVDKGSGAIVVVNSESFTESGKLLVKSQITCYLVGAGNFGGKKTSGEGVVSILPPPNRAPDSSIQYKTNKDQAALYRLSGDYNPLHIDPQMSALGGFKTPILHGLCSLGYSVRAVLAKYANNNAALFKSVKARFTGPIIPGQTIKVEMWKQGKRIHFRTIIVETGKEAIMGGYVDLKDIVSKL